MNICVIPARGGSKRIPRKNIKAFNGKPIIAYSIEAAIESKCFDKVIVSTDDHEISLVSKSYGAEVPFMRPNDLANDYTTTIPVIKHAINWMENENYTIDNVCCLYATAPFIQTKSINKSYKQLIDTDASYCFSVTNFVFPIQRAIKISENNRVNMFYPENFNTRSQDLDESFHDAGQFYWGKAEAFQDEVPIFSNDAVAFILPRYLVQDIDTLEDWVRAELMYQVLLSSNILGS